MSTNQEALKMTKERDLILDAELALNNQFFEVLYSLKSQPKGKNLNHSKYSNLLAINLAEAYELANEYGYDLPSQSDIRNALQYSRHFKFIAANKIIISKRTDKIKRCWIFEQSTTHSIF